MNGNDTTRRRLSGALALARAVRALTQTAGPLRPTGGLSSRWAWIADTILALVLATFATASLALTNQDVNADARHVVLPLGVEPGPAPPDPPEVPGPNEPAAQDSFMHGYSADHPWQLVAAALTALPLLLRRRRPLTAFWCVIGATLAIRIGSANDGTTLFAFTSCVIAGYSAMMYSPYRHATVVSLVTGIVLFAVLRNGEMPDLATGYLPFLLLLSAGLTAEAMHTWRQRTRTLQEEHAAATRLAVERERARIARELHDVVTHNVSVMVIQAGAARKVMDASPDQARDALLAVETGGRTAMSELRHVMGLLTMNDESAEAPLTTDLAPQPGLGRLAALADGVRDTGVPVGLTVTGTPVPLSAGVDLAAYRVVQEALTNAVKHASGARIQIDVAHEPGLLRIEVTDTGGAPTAAARAGNGRGLIGLRERLAVYGGTLRTGARPTGGYRVHAEIPLENP
ncbi:sensor histidine kinase [Streptomyces sp. NBC_01465]|uniref:sensor histidine kinase n=1 Tax=Streptomyces sp. NBC_01465 TaxID=2903878 RepID=UPI002E358BE0|nr:histidine kinase [Streptomyces sp. NBC_01465]